MSLPLFMTVGYVGWWKGYFGRAEQLLSPGQILTEINLPPGQLNFPERKVVVSRVFISEVALSTTMGC